MNRLVTFLAGFSVGAVATAALSAAVVVVLLQSPSTEPTPPLATTQQQATETISPLPDSPSPFQSYEPRTFPYDDPETLYLCTQAVEISDQSDRLDVSEKGLLEAMHELRICGASLTIALRDVSGPPPSDEDFELGSASTENGNFIIEINALDPSHSGTFPIRCGVIRTTYGRGYNCTMLHEMRHVWQFIYAAERPAYWLNLFGKEFDEELAERDAEAWAGNHTAFRVISSSVRSPFE